MHPRRIADFDYVGPAALRAGLVEKAEDYPFIGSSRYTVAMLGDLVQTRKRPWE